MFFAHGDRPVSSQLFISKPGGDFDLDQKVYGVNFSALWARIEKNRKNGHPMIHFPMSEGVSEVSEQVSKQLSAADRASKASSVEQANE